jgi:hypothetical protein
MKHDYPTGCPRQQIDPSSPYYDIEFDSIPTTSDTAQAPPTLINSTLGGADEDATVVLWA